MPESAIAEPPAPKPIPAPGPTSPPSPSPPKMVAPTPPEPPAVPKKGKALAFDELDKFAEKPETLRERPSKRPDKLEEKKPDDKAGVTDKKSEPKTESQNGKAPAVEGDKPPADGDKKKVNPWKIVDEWKDKYAKLEKDYVAVKSTAIDPEKEKQYTERLTASEKRQNELVEELRFHNYEKYDPEFKKNYDQPYQSAWMSAVEEITQLPLTLPDGTVRAATADDLLKLMNLPPVDARERAEEMFGKFADDALAHRKEVRRLFDARHRALEEAKKTLGETEKKRMETFQAQHKTMSEAVGKVWQEANQKALEHEQYGEYFKPVEGDEEGNLKLAKGFELADRAFTESPFDPKLKPEERAAIVRRHSAVRNRAAAFGRIVLWNKTLKEQVASLEKELSDYRNGEPKDGDSKAWKKNPSERGMEGALNRLGKLAA